ncbi:hypothetical protein [Pedobacter frigiditerrae]|uniref:hypothetical protein n=1 Tax=Pedobacter frigiditerrae TaxID=2530452 RepID=UPI0019813CAF|nr:hypothetical protein [Pedobacter frigiditerrae]
MKKIYLILTLGIFALNSFAQKLPDVQEVNMLAPASIKIDGKATEWNDTFAAENKRTELFYNIANDDKNLYVIIKSANSTVVNKIMLGGITFTVNTQGKKRDKDASSLTYPVINRANRQQRTGGQGQARQQGGAQGGFQNRTQMSTQQRDSAALVQRKAQLATVKEIKVSGFKAITDSLISIYNEYGVKAVASFDQKGAFVYEIAVPLSILELSTTSTKEFVYQIKLNGLSNMNFGGGGGGNFGGGGGNFGGGGNRGGNGGGGNFGGGGGQDLMSPTDFWAKYSFQKK